MPFELNEYHRNIAKEDLIADLQRVASINNLSTVPQKLYGQLGKYTHKVFYANFGSWNNALLAAGLPPFSRLPVGGISTPALTWKIRLTARAAV